MTVIPLHEDTATSAEVEQYLLGALLAANSAYGAVSYLRPDDFTDERHASIFSTLAATIERGEEANAITLAPILPGLEPEGYLRRLELCAISASSASVYARSIKTMSNARRLQALVTTAAGELNNPASMDGLLEEIQLTIDEIRDDGVERRPIVSVGEAANSAVADAIDIRERRERGEAVPFISTGLAVLDRELGGLRGGQLIIIAGASSMGKSAFALTIAQNVAAEYAGTNRARHVMFESLEMSEDDLAHRALARLSDIPVPVIAGGKFNVDQIPALTAAQERLQTMPLYIDVVGGATVHSLRLDAMETRRKHGLDLIIVDYLQLMTGKGDNRTQEVGSISRGLKTLATDLNVPVIAVSQLSRAVNSREGNRPQLSDLRESGSIEQDADVVLFAHNQAYYERNKPPPSGTPEYSAWEADIHEMEKRIEIIIGKQRQGPAGHSVSVGFSKHTVSMFNEGEQGGLV